MKEKKLIRKLNFYKETVANLNSNEMFNLIGGLPPRTYGCVPATILLPCTWGNPCSYSQCDSLTNSGAVDPACQCPDPSSMANC